MKLRRVEEKHLHRLPEKGILRPKGNFADSHNHNHNLEAPPHSSNLSFHIQCNLKSSPHSPCSYLRNDCPVEADTNSKQLQQNQFSSQCLTRTEQKLVNFVEIVGYEPDFSASLPTTSYIHVLSYDDDDDDDDDDDLMEGRYVHIYVSLWM